MPDSSGTFELGSRRGEGRRKDWDVKLGLNYPKITSVPSSCWMKIDPAWMVCLEREGTFWS